MQKWIRLATYLGRSTSSTSSADGSNSYSGSTSSSDGGSAPSTTSSGSSRITSGRCVSIDTNRVNTTWISSTPPSSVGVRNASISASAAALASAYDGLSE